METKLSLQNGLILYADSNEQPSLAPLMLAWFGMSSAPKRAAEFCSGNGCCSFWCCDRGFKGTLDLVDLRKDQLELAKKTIAENAVENVYLYNEDITLYRSDRVYDLILCNPPFFDEECTARDSGRSSVRHENGLTPEQLCRAAAVNIKHKGHFKLCYIPSRLTDMLVALRNNGFEAKEIKFCRHKAENEPFLVLIDAIFKGGKGLSVSEDLLVFDNEGNYTPEMVEICEKGWTK